MKLGLFGGSFDPPHIGHLVSAVESYYQLGLDKLLFIPTYQNRLKTSSPVASTEERALMLHIMTTSFWQSDIHWGVDTRELKAQKSCPSIETIQQFYAESSGEDEIFFIAGYDNLLTLPQWTRTQEYKNYCTTVLIDRGNKPEGNYDECYKQIQDGHRILILDKVPTLSVSSTEVKRRIAQGLPYMHLVPYGVYWYIKQKGLYHE